MPRSQSRTLGLPCARMYSAASSHSSMRSLMPRLSRMGFPLRAASMRSWKFCAVARADLKDVRDLRDMLDIAFAKHLRDDLEPGLLAGEGKQPKAFLAESLKFVRRSARLVGAAAQDGRARRLHRLGRAEKLFLAFDRAGPGHEAKRLRRRFRRRPH